MTASPASPSDEGGAQPRTDVLAHDEAADEPDHDRLEPQHERRQGAADVGHRVRRAATTARPRPKAPITSDARHRAAQAGHLAARGERPARRRRAACARASRSPGRSRAARSRRAGTTTTKTPIANASSAKAERGAAGGLTAGRGAAARARTPPPRARPPRAGASSAVEHRAHAPRAVRVGAQADERARARDRRAEELDELGVAAHVGAVDLERDVVRRRQLGDPVEARARDRAGRVGAARPRAARDA